MRSIWEVGSEQLCYYEERNDIGENYIIIIGKDNDNESENVRKNRINKKWQMAATGKENIVTVQSQPPKCFAFRRCGVSAK